LVWREKKRHPFLLIRRYTPAAPVVACPEAPRGTVTGDIQTVPAILINEGLADLPWQQEQPSLQHAPRDLRLSR
jgi:hypothetical protein